MVIRLAIEDGVPKAPFDARAALLKLNSWLDDEPIRFLFVNVPDYIDYFVLRLVFVQLLSECFVLRADR